MKWWLCWKLIPFACNWFASDLPKLGEDHWQKYQSELHLLKTRVWFDDIFKSGR